MAIVDAASTRTPRESRRQERKARLVNAALRLFSTEGFNETSVDDIVSAARTSKSAFYEFWSSKEDCVRDQLSEQGGALIDRVFTIAANGADQRDRMLRGSVYFVFEYVTHLVLSTERCCQHTS